MDKERIEDLRARHKRRAMNEGPERDRLLHLIRELAYEEGRRKLSSGRFTDFYLDCRRITLNEEGIHLCASEVFRLLARDDVSPAGICGKAVGGVPIAIGVSLVRRSVRLEGLARARTDEAMEIVNFMYPTLHSLIARDAPKEHGMELALEGGANLSPGDPVAIIDDVASSGKSLIDAVNVVKEAGFAVVWVGCLVDRLEGAREALEAVGYSLRPLFTIDEIRQ